MAMHLRARAMAMQFAGFGGLRACVQTGRGGNGREEEESGAERSVKRALDRRAVSCTGGEEKESGAELSAKHAADRGAVSGGGVMCGAVERRNAALGQAVAELASALQNQRCCSVKRRHGGAAEHGWSMKRCVARGGAKLQRSGSEECGARLRSAAGCTDLLQLVEAGLGLAVKGYMNSFFAEGLTQKVAGLANIDRMARKEKDGNHVSARERLVLYTHLLASAWTKLCDTDCPNPTPEEALKAKAYMYAGRNAWTSVEDFQLAQGEFSEG
ncbi:hypothetical protein T484DRAFT_1863235 [Baffinella frigidus]|nr:hypothetical protein T484DRAFT_1863235 [Cryptophyta sp. CCMP2293]